jgi:hypothetical protein
MSEEMTGTNRETVRKALVEDLKKTTARQCTQRTLRAFFPIFLAKRKIPMSSHLPYSPDLASVDLFLFPKLKISMKGTRFEVVSSIQQTVTRELKAIREQAFSRAFDSLYERCKRCAEAGGNYIE